MTQLKRLPQPEFVALVAMLFATIAFSVDSMLPALTTIGQELSPSDINRSSMIVGVFILGMGVGTFFSGALADAFGRKRVIIITYCVFILSAIIAGFATSLELMLLARFVQGLAVAGPRIAGVAMVRDLYSGPKMASIMSFAMLIFGLVPALAPLLGQGVMILFGWRAIFYSMAVFGALVGLWMLLRQPETLTKDNIRPLRLSSMWDALKFTMSNRVFRFALAVQTCLYGALFATISSVHAIYDVVYGRADTFALWFGAVAVLTMPASFINARIVERTGMRKIINLSIRGQLICSTLLLGVYAAMGAVPFALFFAWQISVLLLVGFSFGNLGALAMEPMGKIAGMAASINSAISTMLSIAIAMPIGLAFNGTELPLLLGVWGCLLIAMVLMVWFGPRRPEDLS